MSTNVPIPGMGPARPRAQQVAARRAGSSRARFLGSVAALVLSALAVALLAWGEPLNLAPGMSSSFAKSIAALAITFAVTLPAFAFFRYERQSAGARWHEPAWRPTLIGWVALLVALLLAIGWHGLRLALYAARAWTGQV